MMSMKNISAEALGHISRLLSKASRQHMRAVRGLAPAELTRAFPEQLGLYVHVPFCRRICTFCPYNKALYDAELARRYTAAARSELAMLAPALRRRQVTSVYIGGGTPTLAPALIEHVCELAADLGVPGEIGVEVLPNHATPRRLRHLRSLGVTHVSLGVQSFDDRVLSFLGRSHDARTARRAVDAVLAEGFECVDVDLVFDVATFGERGVVSDAAELFALGAGQLSVYPMMRFAYTAVGQSKDHNERAEKRALGAIERAGRWHGYTRTSVWTFNIHPARRYTSITREHYVGVGPSGSSFLDGTFTINTFDTAAYVDLLQEGVLPVVMRSDMGGRAAQAYYLFWRFYEGSVSRARFSQLFGVPVERHFFALLALLGAAGALRVNGDTYQLTGLGFDLFHTVERWVTYNFIEPTWAACREAPYPDELRL